MVPDYTSQLEQITSALSHPGLPPWGIALLSALLGFLTSIGIQIFQPLLNDLLKQRKMRKVLYFEIAAVYTMLKVIMKGIQEDVPDGKVTFEDFPAPYPPIRGAAYIAANLETFVQLKEHITFDSLYYALEQMKGKGATGTNVKNFLCLVKMYVDTNVLDRRYFKYMMVASVNPPFPAEN